MRRVSTAPGEIVLARMPCAAWSVASTLANWIRAPLLAQYAARLARRLHGAAPRSPGAAGALGGPRAAAAPTAVGLPWAPRPAVALEIGHRADAIAARLTGRRRPARPEALALGSATPAGVRLCCAGVRSLRGSAADSRRRGRCGETGGESQPRRVGGGRPGQRRVDAGVDGAHEVLTEGYALCGVQSPGQRCGAGRCQCCDASGDGCRGDG
jgi:hypothetical protein